MPLTLSAALLCSSRAGSDINLQNKGPQANTCSSMFKIDTFYSTKEFLFFSARQQALQRKSRQIRRAPLPQTVQPEYLSVSNFQDCLGEYKSRDATYRCLPITKPAKCPEDSWTQLEEVFPGIACPKEDRKRRESDVDFEGAKKAINSLRCLKIVDGETCLPASRPAKCPTDVWEQFQVDFEEC